MAILKQKESTAMRDAEMANLLKMYQDAGETIVQTESGAYGVARVSADGETVFVKLGVSVPKGERGGDGWDAIADSEFYASEVIRKEAEAQVKAEAKAKKIAKDTALRADKEANKA